MILDFYSPFIHNFPSLNVPPDNSMEHSLSLIQAFDRCGTLRRGLQREILNSLSGKWIHWMRSRSERSLSWHIWSRWISLLRPTVECGLSRYSNWGYCFIPWWWWWWRWRWRRRRWWWWRWWWNHLKTNCFQARSLVCILSGFYWLPFAMKIFFWGHHSFLPF